MRSTHSRLKLGLVAAFCIEAVNFWIIGYPAAMHPVSEISHHPAVAIQWYLLHLPGIVASDHSIFLREHAALDSVMFFIAGYIVTAILIYAILWFAGLARRTLRRLSSPMKQAA